MEVNSRPVLMLAHKEGVQVPRVFWNPIFEFYEEGTSSLWVDLFLSEVRNVN